MLVHIEDVILDQRTWDEAYGHGYREPRFKPPCYRGRHFYFQSIDWIILIYSVDSYVDWRGRVWNQSFVIYRYNFGDDFYSHQ